MCFRPAEISMNMCPNCGKANKPIATVCEQCGKPLEKMVVDMDADQAALDASNTAIPGAPAAPKPPAPSAPKAPGAPKPPVA